MRRTSAFTLVEMLVAFALVLFIMVILTEAFAKSLQAFRELKATGDLEERLRGVTGMLRRDLAADHFEGRRRLSDPARSWSGPDEPREGFFRVANRDYFFPIQEGRDADGLPAQRRTNRVLHFSVKLRGNDRQDFFTANVPDTSPLRGPTTFFGHPSDARYIETNTVYNSQWAEIAYFLEPNGRATGAAPLYGLYRTQYVVVADNRVLELGRIPSAERTSSYREVSCQHDRVTGFLHFNTPGDLASGSYRYPRWVDDTQPVVPRRAFNPLRPTRVGASLLLTDVLSFDVQSLGPGDSIFQDNTFDTTFGRPVILALRLQVRLWDAKTRQSRQITLIQDM